MILKTKVTTEQEIEFNLETPAFYKTKVTETITEYLGVIHENTINIWDFTGTRTFIENCATEKRHDEIAKAITTWKQITEEEFFEALNKALKDFDFKPTLKYKTLPILTHEEQEERDRDREEERVNDYWERELDRD